MKRIKNISGQKIGYLTAIKPCHIVNNGKSRKTFWVFECICGTQISRRADQKYNQESSCGCKRNKKRTPDLTSKKFNRLVVVKPNGIDNNGSFRWECLCECGNTSFVTTHNLLSNKIRSCGCLTKEVAKKLFKENIHNKKLHIHYKPIEISGLNKVFSSYRVGAKNRGVFFKLNKDQISSLIKQNCYYCGIEPSNIHINGYTKEVYKYNGIDRKDNSVGYTSENVVPCCIICNKAKRDMAYDEFISWIQRISKRFGLVEPA